MSNLSNLSRYLRIMPKFDISIDTPILYITIDTSFLIPTSNRNVYDIDIDEVRQYLHNLRSNEFENPSHIDDYVPIGQIQISPQNFTVSTISTILVNTRIVPQTNTYKQIKPNVWIAEANVSNTKMRSIGTIYSKSKPNFQTPVFPISYLKRTMGFNNNIYSDPKYGKFILNDTALNVDKKNMRMIDTSLNISFIPKNVDRKVYFTAQGTISNDPVCVKSDDKIDILECNAQIDTKLDTKLDTKIDKLDKLDIKSDIKSDSKSDPKLDTIDKSKKLRLVEKDEPWFLNPDIVGDIAHPNRDPHTITGHHVSLQLTDEELYDVLEDLKPNGTYGTITGDSDNLVLIGTFDGEQDEVNAVYSSNCKVDPQIAHSRYESYLMCNNIEGFTDADKNYTNIVRIICIVIILLMVYKFLRR